MSKFLVTGGAGFIGSNIVERLVREGHEVVVLDNLCEGNLENLAPFMDKIKFVKGDIRNESDLDKATAGVDYVLHQAALRSVPKSMERPLEYNEVNVDGTLMLLKKARERGVRRVVYASSSSVYGERDRFPQREDDPANPISPYAATKLLGEYYCRLFSNSFGLETVSLRYFNVFGPRQSLDSQYAVVIPKFITCILEGKCAPVDDDGLQERDFTYVDNVVEANIRAATAKGVSGEVFNVACGTSNTVLSIVDHVNRILGKNVKPEFKPKRPGDVRKTLADITRLKEKLGVKEFVRFEEGLKKTVEWFKNRKPGSRNAGGAKKSRKKRVVITGGAGFIGSHLSERLLGEGYAVLCIDNLITGKMSNIGHLMKNPFFEFAQHDVSGYINVDGDIYYVLHFASPASPIDYHNYPIQTLKVGSLGTHNTLGLARKKKAKYLLASTSEIYGDPLVNPQKEDYWGNVNPTGPRGVYDEAKRFAEAITLAYHRTHGLDAKIARIFNTYGERMRENDGRAIPNFATQALSGKALTVYGKGKQTRSFCYVSDLVEGLYRLMLSGINTPVNLGNPNEITVLELARRVIKHASSKSRIVYRPLPKDDPKVRRPDISLAKRKLKWKPKVTLEQGLKRTIEWFKSVK